MSGRESFFVPQTKREFRSSIGAFLLRCDAPMLTAQRSARNPILEVMRDYGYVEHRGMGVRRKIVPLTREYAGRDASFEATDDFLRVTLPARPTPP